MRILFSKLTESIGNASKLLSYNRSLITNSPMVSQVRCYNRSLIIDSPVVSKVGCYNRSLITDSPGVSHVRCYSRSLITDSPVVSQVPCYNQNYDESYFVHLFKKKIKEVESISLIYVIHPGRIHASLVKNGMRSDEILCKQLRLYASCGFGKEAKEFFYECYHLDVAGLGVWNAAIIGLGLHQQGLEAIKIYNNIPEHLVCTQATYWNVMVAAGHQRELEFSHYVLGKIYKNLCMEPTIEHIGTYIVGLARNGYLVEAYREVRVMTYRPSYEVIVSILSRCQSNVMNQTAVAIKNFEFLEEREVSYRIIRHIYTTLASDGVKWKSNVRILNQRVIGGSL